MSTPNQSPEERIARANELAAQGQTPREIAAAMGMSHSALRSLMKRAGRKFVVVAAQFLPVEEGNTRRKQEANR